MDEQTAWLKEHTFSCPIGRVTQGQCKSLRERPHIRDGGGGPYLSGVCENCKEWRKHMIPLKKTEEDVVQKVKKCSKCGRVVPVTEFYANKKSKDGLGSQCKKCIKVFVTTREVKHVSLKIPLEMYSEIRELAERDLRNTGNQIIFLIRKALEV